jgi:hypothetical protein
VPVTVAERSNHSSKESYRLKNYCETEKPEARDKGAVEPVKKNVSSADGTVKSL